MKLNLVKGFETSLIIDKVDYSIKENGFLAESYIKAKDALKSYVSQTDKIRKELETEKNVSGMNNCLYRSPQNIIAFSGKRGTGKTSTMLSFSQSLSEENSIVRSEAMQNRGVVVLDPIDPTMLENDQNILNVVLSRLLFKAEEVWNQSVDCSRRYQDKEKEKNEILALSKKCLNGISAIKSKSSMETLADLQKTGDSAILKRDFYELVEKLNRFCLSSVNSASSYPLLVLQIDDTDCQIGKGYQVMEDIRRYLTIPNLVIFMAVDLDMMRLVLTQHFVGEFSSGLQQKFVDREATKHYADKYMAKLLPPTHKIYLPVVDEIIRNKTDIIDLGYYEVDDVEQKDNILKKGDGFQSRILNFIYQKTHLVFSVHKTYLNNIIPSTLRGLTYLLNILSSMEDIPEIDFSKANDTSYMIEQLNEQLPVLEKNLDVFEEYFMNDWIHAKLSHEMVAIIENIASRVSEHRIGYAYDEVRKYYNMKEIDTTDPTVEFPEENNPSYYDLDLLLQRILGTTDKGPVHNTYCQTEDYYNIFAVRTLLSIKNNKDVIKIKRQTINKISKDSNTSPLVFDYKKEKTSLPNRFYLDEKVYDGEKIVNIKLGEKYNFTDNIISCLSADTFASLEKSQGDVFGKQEIAILIASNFELQEVVRKQVKNMEAEESCQTLDIAVKEALKKIQSEISKMNDNMLEKYNENSVDVFVCLGSPKEVEQEADSEQKPGNQIVDLEEINKLFRALPTYPTSNSEELIEGIKKSLIRFTEKFEQYLDKYMSAGEQLTKDKELAAQLKECAVSFDSESTHKNREEYEALLKKVEDCLTSMKS